MIIKSHVRGGYRAAADYLKDQGKNEQTRLVEISDPDAKNLDQAFHNMWAVASATRAIMPIHHISINPLTLFLKRSMRSRHCGPFGVHQPVTNQTIL
jgi:hypothetical protein